MARTDKRYRAAHNRMVDILADHPVGALLPSEPKLAEMLKVSRTTVRAILRTLEAEQSVKLNGREKVLLKRLDGSSRIEELPETIPMEELERKFLDWILRFDIPANTPLNVAQLAKQFSVPPHGLQTFLTHLAGFGLVERLPRGGWVLLGFTTEYAYELSELRKLLELNAIEAFAGLPAQHPVWMQLDLIEQEHRQLLLRIDSGYQDFPALDVRFHAMINSVVANRFVAGFQKVISLIFHYHYQWDKRLERLRNGNAITEHLAIIAALKSRDKSGARQAMKGHINTSKETLEAALRTNLIGS